MKTNGKPAYVEDIDETGDAVLGSRRSARRVTKVPTRQRRSSYRVAQAVTVARSVDKGPLERAIKEYTGPRPITLLSGSHDKSNERNEVKGHPLRKVFYNDKVVNRQHDTATETYIERKIYISGTDAACDTPYIFLEQQIYENDQQVVVGKQLIIDGRLQENTVYVFKECGDEIRGVGRPELRLKFCLVFEEKWADYIKRAVYYGYDKNFESRVSAADIKDGSLYCPFNGGPFNGGEEGCTLGSQQLGLSISSTHLRNIFGANFADSGSTVRASTATTKNGLWSKRDAGSSGDRYDQKAVPLSLKLHGFGERSEDGAHTGDINLQIYLRP